MTFGPWEIPDNQAIEAAVRYERAVSIKADNVEAVDLEEKTCFIKGSDGEFYIVSLEECGCQDFGRRGLPCKHMIRLAMELGLPFDIPQFDPYAAFDYDIQEDIARLTNRWHSGQLTIEALSKCVNALKSSASKAKRRPGRPKKKA